LHEIQKEEAMKKFAPKALLFLVFLLVLQLIVGVTTALAEPGWHVVRWGETLYSIGRMYGVSPYAIAAANGLPNPNYIQGGQRLYIPGPGDGHGPGDDHGHGPGPGNYIVRPGDTLSGIAWRFHTTVWAIAQANGIGNPNHIHIGQWLRIP
jgi:LysM repeat protein